MATARQEEQRQMQQQQQQQGEAQQRGEEGQKQGHEQRQQQKQALDAAELARATSRARLLSYQQQQEGKTSLGPEVLPPYLTRRCDAAGQQPLFSFGVITDIQYADIDDGCSFLGIPRYYRHSLEVTRQAVRSWNSAGRVSFAVHFGDIVDGFCPRSQSLTAFHRVLSELNQLKTGPVYHMLGNHCLYNLPRQKLNEILSIPTDDSHKSYYQFSPYPGFRFVVLDAYDVSLLGWPPDHPHAVAAEELLNAQNPNADKNNPEGLVGTGRRFVKFNGGVGKLQLQWLEICLTKAEAAKEVVIVCCHLPIDPLSLPTGTCLLWNYDEVLRVLHAHKCVAAFMCGHAHFGAYSQDDHSIHHRVLEAVLECPPGTNAFGCVDVYPDRLCLIGTGRMRCTEMRFTPVQQLSLRAQHVVHVQAGAAAAGANAECSSIRAASDSVLEVLPAAALTTGRASQGGRETSAPMCVRTRAGHMKTTCHRLDLAVPGTRALSSL